MVNLNLKLNHQKLVTRGQWMDGIKKQDTVLRPWHTTEQFSLCQHKTILPGHGSSAEVS